LEHAIREATAEIDRLRKRISHLESLISRAQAALGQQPTPTTRLTLHRALDLILSENSNRWMSAMELAQAVNDRGLYRMRDGRPVEAGQIHARVRNYSDLFEITEGSIRLRYAFDTFSIPSTGAYDAAATKVTLASDPACEMVVELRVTYSAVPQAATDPSQLALERAAETARTTVAKDGFVDGERRCFLLTTTGVQRDHDRENHN